MRRTTAPGSDNGFYVDEDRNQGRQGTAITAEDRNAIQDELIHIIELAGLVPSGADNTQVGEAVRRMVSDSIQISTSQSLDLTQYNSSLFVTVSGVAVTVLTLNGVLDQPGAYLAVRNDGTEEFSIDGNAGIGATLVPGGILLAVGDGITMRVHSLTTPFSRQLLQAPDAAAAQTTLDLYSKTEVDSSIASVTSMVRNTLQSLVTNQWDERAKLVAADGVA
ncbi:MAG: hypothetical protein MI724_02345, partial [Spirochaetales bacterium]|nr:hypothetical protein [Spirochaetales bacterium]